MIVHGEVSRVAINGLIRHLVAFKHDQRMKANPER